MFSAVRALPIRVLRIDCKSMIARSWIACRFPAEAGQSRRLIGTPLGDVDELAIGAAEIEQGAAFAGRAQARAPGRRRSHGRRRHAWRWSRIRSSPARRPGWASRSPRPRCARPPICSERARAKAAETCLLILAQDVDGEDAGRLEGLQAIGAAVEAEQHERRIEGNRVEGVGGEAKRLAVAARPR